MNSKEKAQYHLENKLPYQINDTDIRRCRKQTKCGDGFYGCGKTINKGDVYFRRSFGRVWTWKACSVKCALKMIKWSSMWIY